MTSTTSFSLFSPNKLSQQKLTFCTLKNNNNNNNYLPSNGHIKFNPNLKNPISKLFITNKNPHLLKFKHIRSHINSMFTGIVEEIGKVKQMSNDTEGGFHLKVEGNIVLQDVKLGDSIAVNGTCLTVTEFDGKASEFTLGLAPETLRKTTLLGLEPGSVVNLERALQLSTRMGGHFVQVMMQTHKWARLDRVGRYDEFSLVNPKSIYVFYSFIKYLSQPVGIKQYLIMYFGA